MNAKGGVKPDYEVIKTRLQTWMACGKDCVKAAKVLGINVKTLRSTMTAHSRNYDEIVSGFTKEKGGNMDLVMSAMRPKSTGYLALTGNLSR